MEAEQANKIAFTGSLKLKTIRHKEYDSRRGKEK